MRSSGDLLLLECKWEGSAGLLDEQTRSRLEQFPEALGILGVVYPDRLQSVDDIQASLSAADDLIWRLHGSRGAVTSGHRDRSGSVEGLAAQLRHLPLDLEGSGSTSSWQSESPTSSPKPTRRMTNMARLVAAK